MSCKKAQGFLEKHDVSVKSVSDARKQRQSRADVLTLAKSAATIYVAKGKKVTVFDMKTDAPDDPELLRHLLGPTGNLRAPTALIGQTLLVGFSEDVYRRILDHGPGSGS